MMINRKKEWKNTMAVPACVRKAITKYNKKAYHLVSVYAPKGTKEKVKGLAKESNMSFAKYIREAIEEKIVFDGLLSREEFFRNGLAT